MNRTLASVACVTIGVIVGVAAQASPLDIVARYHFDARVDVVGRRATVELRVRDEGRAPVADLPVLIEFTPADGTDAESQNRVLMTDRDGLVRTATRLSDGEWNWQINAVPDRFVQTEPSTGSVRSAADVVNIELPSELIRRPGLPLDVAAVLTVGDARADGLDTRARLRCPGMPAQTMTSTSDVLGRVSFSFSEPASDAGSCNLSLSVNADEEGLTGEAFSTVRIAQGVDLHADISPGASVLGLVRSWRVDAVASDVNGVFSSGVYVLGTDEREVARWQLNDVDAGSIPGEELRAGDSVQVAFYADARDLTPLAVSQIEVRAPGLDPTRVLGLGALLIVAALALLRLAKYLMQHLRPGRRLTARAAAAEGAVRAAPAPGVWFFEEGTSTRLVVRVICGTETFVSTGGRWMPKDLTAPSWSIEAGLDGFVPVQRTITREELDRGVRIDLFTWRRSIIELLVEVLRDLGVARAGEAWWGTKSPSRLRKPAVEHARGLSAESDLDGLQWPTHRARLQSAGLRPHEALEMLFSLADRVAFADSESIGPQAHRDAEALARIIRQRAAGAGGS